jgi:hypothetical protein
VFFRLLLWGNEKVSHSISLIINLKSAGEFIPLRNTDEHGGIVLMGYSGVLSFTSGGNEKVSRSISLIINLKIAREFIPLRSTDEHGGFFLLGCTGVL